MAKLIIFNSPEEAGLESRRLSAVLIRGSHLSIVVTVEEDEIKQQPIGPERGSSPSSEDES